MFLRSKFWSQCYANHALITHKINVSDGGKQPFLRDSVWDGKLQKLVTEEGIQRSL